jgi:uncharacterized protein YqjF (DUF2071 family)
MSWAAEKPRVPKTSAACDDAARRLFSRKGDPFLCVRWQNVVFLNFTIAADVLQKVVPEPFELELHNGVGCVSLAAVTMKKFRSCRRCSPAQLFQLLREQRFLNLRTYVKHQGEPGALFLFGWLSAPHRLTAPSSLFRLPYSFGALSFDHAGQTINGSVTSGSDAGKLVYECESSGRADFEPCPTGSLSEFAMERYSGFFARAGGAYVFRVWHPPWKQLPLTARIEDTSLVVNRFPWFAHARFAEARITDSIDEVWMGQAHKLPEPPGPGHGSHRVLSAFYDMP